MLLPLSEGVGYMTILAGLWGSVSRADYAACALEVGTLYPQCWAPTVAFYNETSAPTNTSFWAISNGGYFVCGLLYDSHYPSCWGYLNNSAIPSQFQSTSYSNINSGGWHACAVRDNTTDNPGQVDCWGNNVFGQASPPTDETFISVTAGDYFTCGLTARTRQVKCWGYSITQGDSSIQAPNASFDSIFAGRYHMCGLELDTKKTLCWGNNTFQQAQPPENLNLTVITGGYRFSCGLREDTHEAACWGDSKEAQTNSPAGVPLSTISSGDWYTCGVREDEQKMVVTCWGAQDKATNVPLTLKASMGLCVKQCTEGQREVLDSEFHISLHQCPNNGDKVCVECEPGKCPASNLTLPLASTPVPSLMPLRPPAPVSSSSLGEESSFI